MKEVDSYCCSIKAMFGLLQHLKAVGISREKFTDAFINSSKRSKREKIKLMGNITRRFTDHPLLLLQGSTDFKFQKSPLCYTYESVGIHNFALLIEFISKETGPLS